MPTPMTEFDIFYISFDEPRKEEFWAELLNLVPWAKRVDSVVGFDNAHKACASQSETDFFITIDGDNKVDDDFFNNEMQVDSNIGCYSWRARNNINNLVYGNGGIKLWRTDFVHNMKSHENATDKRHLVDFCWEDAKYIQMHDCYSTTFPNQSALHSFRAGLREGVKMSLDQGTRLTPGTMNKMWWGNRERLLVWMNVGLDSSFGFEAMLGARIGCYNLLTNDKFDYVNIRNFKFIDDIYHSLSAYKIDDFNYYGEKLTELGLPAGNIDSPASLMFKEIYSNRHRNLGINVSEKEALYRA